MRWSPPPPTNQRLLENERVHVLHTLIPSGAIVPLHTHRCPCIAYLLSWSDFIRRDHHGNVLLDSRRHGMPPKVPAVQWLDPLPPHTVENVGQSEISILIVSANRTHGHLERPYWADWKHSTTKPMVVGC
jgi:hypothetical protein